MRYNKLFIIGFITLITITGIILIVNTQKERLLQFLLGRKYQALIYKTVEIPSAKLNYRFFTPEKNEEQLLPLVLYLHGGAQRGLDNKQQLDYVLHAFSSSKKQKKHPCFIIAPQCPLNGQWVNTTFKTIPFDHYDQDKIPESNEMKLIHSLIFDLINLYPIDPNRIYIIGFSMGGSGTWDMITRYPNMFAAAIPLSGVSDTSKAYLLKKMPIWAFHGENDKISPIRLNQEMVETINLNGGNAKLTTFKNRGHGIVRDALNTKNLFQWLFDKNKKN